jgi:hypothetical protein
MNASRFVAAALKLLVVVGVVAMLLTARSVRAGIFDSARDEVRGSSGSSSSGGGKHRGGGHGHHDDDDGDSFLGSLLGGILEGIFSGGSDHHHHDDHFYDESYYSVEEIYVPPARFASFPYADGAPGVLLPGIEDEGAAVPGRGWSGRFAFDYASDFDSIQHWGGRVLIEGCSRWGVDADWTVLNEDLGPGMGHDRIDVGDVNLLFRLIETDRSLWRIGVGMNWFDDSVDTDYGANFTLRADFFPAHPWIYSAEIDLGKLGGADYFHFNVTAGVMWNRLHFFTGYDYRKIGGIELNGMVFGTQIWF